MKKIAFLLLSTALVAFISCGSSEQDEKKIKQEQDSMSIIDGDIAIDRANELLSDTSMNTADSATTETKPKK